MAEPLLRERLPQSLQAYGYIFQKNRVKSDHIDVLVDRWPDFRILVTRPLREKEEDYFKDMCIYTTDRNALREILDKKEIVSWQKYLCIGTNLCHEETIMSVAAANGATGNMVALCHVLRLEDPSHLPEIDSGNIQVSSLDESHISLVNEAWKFGRGEHSMKFIQNLVRNFPSCCVLDDNGQPVAWILTYDYSAMGMLYTMPQHRRKGYAKILISAISKKLFYMGYPVFCFIEEENLFSLNLFKSMGFKDEPSYRNAWFTFNQLH